MHEKCKGCNKIKNEVCIAYVNPSYWWDKMGGCPLASHIIKIEKKEKIRLGQQKQKGIKK